MQRARERRDEGEAEWKEAFKKRSEETSRKTEEPGGCRLEDRRPSADSRPLETRFLSLGGSELAGTGLFSGYGSQGSGRHTEVSPLDQGCVLIFM